MSTELVSSTATTKPGSKTLQITPKTTYIFAKSVFLYNLIPDLTNTKERPPNSLRVCNLELEHVTGVS